MDGRRCSHNFQYIKITIAKQQGPTYSIAVGDQRRELLQGSPIVEMAYEEFRMWYALGLTQQCGGSQNHYEAPNGY